MTGAVRSTRLLAVVVLAAVQFTIILDETAIALLAPSVGRDLDLGDQARHLLVTPFAASFVVMLPVAVLALRRVDPSRALPLVACAFALSAVAGALAPTTISLVVARSAQGATAAATTICVLAALHLVTMGRPSRTRDFAVFSTVSGAGSITALLVAGPLAAVSWRWCFWAVAIAVLTCMLAWRAVSSAVPGQSPDAGHRIEPDDHRSPIARRDWHAHATVVAANAILAASVITVSFALQQDHGWSPIAAGLGFGPLNVAAAAGAVLVARRSAGPEGARNLLIAGFFALVLGCSVLAATPVDPAVLITATVPIGFGIGVAFPLANDRALAGPGHRALQRAAELGVAQQTGLAVGAVVAAAHSGFALAALACVVTVGVLSAGAVAAVGRARR
ncbi:MFS transporter [Gordonia sp. HY002]|uniref:MFS transporter n=1 Tax=Gordonia zhenghanii TaxID=2911516 RepID=UPI001EF02CEF|nr:MFS transporter [Gordonia zhenghanii]MCF8571961.1 MFS transporter [Gordonia zhenghanii]MCF8604179.1 MFS transporter [Gordonia zhenghanii]